MKGKGLSFDVIVAAALQLVNEKGYNKFSVRELAASLQVKAASLYNHLKSIDEINVEIGKIAAHSLNEKLEEAAAGKNREDALRALAVAYRDFVKNNYQLFLAINDMPSLDQGDKAVITTGRDSVKVIRSVIDQYDIAEQDKINFSRSLRSMLTGYVTNEMAGYYTSGRVSMEDSFSFMIEGMIHWLQSLERENKRTGAAE